MNQKQFGSRCAWRRRALSLLLAALMVLGFFPGVEGTDSEASAHWADPYLSQLAEWGFIRQNQMNNPDRALTRADFMSIVNKAYNYHELGETPFEDVQESDWFFDDVSIAYTAKYMVGTSATTASPNNPLTRETAATILGRNMMLEESPGALVEFTDSNKISTWAMGTIKSSLEHYLISGYSDGSFRPQRNVSWGEMASMITSLIGTPLQEPGDYALGGVFGNVTITSPNVTLRDTIISGDLYISGGVGLGGIKLENVTVLGRIVVCGTGNSETGEASVLLRNVTADEMLIDNLQDNFVSVQADGITMIGRTTVRTGAYIEDNTPEGMGLQYISLEGDSYPEGEEPEDWEPPLFQLAGRIKQVVNRTPNSTVQVGRGTVEKLTVDEAAAGSNVIIDRGAVVKELSLDTGTIVTGGGDIEHLIVNAPGCEVEMLPDKITIRPGITAIIAGEEMDAVAAEEASTDPLILAGYPEAQDIVPTGLDAAFMTNKAGTIYWAVSNITDGSVGEDDLIKPPSYGFLAVAHGSLPVANGNEETIAKVTGLLPGGSYYLSAILVDNKGNHSPVKVISFTTPDNTVPAFCEGYPYMSKVSCKDSMVVVMPNKDCKLYYALLPVGAMAPTESEMRAAAISGALGYGVRDVFKNTEDIFRVNDVTLDEQTDYIVYFFLMDADGRNKSGIISLPFTTDDETPPEFIVDPTPNNIQATSVGLTFRLNEDGIVYWVAVPAGTLYPKPEPGTDYETAPLTSDYARLQVVSGMNLGADGKSGQVNAVMNADGTINVAGLKPESAYDFYYVAKDNAGPDRNYSVTVKKITINTLDNSGPKVTQSFSKTSGLDKTKDPMSTTDIYLDFSENVRYTGQGGGRSFLDLYQDIKAASSDSAEREAINKLAANLFGAIKLHKINIQDNSEETIDETHSTDKVFTEKMTIDYTQAYVEAKKDGSGIRVTFPSSGLHLENGGQYYFTIGEITDTSNNYNEISPDPVDFWTNAATSTANGHNVPPFMVEFAAVNLTSPGVGGKDGPIMRDDNGNLSATDEMSRIDFSFRMTPISTKTVANTIGYDVLLWVNKNVVYKLYYRVLDETGEKLLDENGNYPNEVTVGSGDNQETVKDYLIPQQTGSRAKPTVDANGWIYLGSSEQCNTGESGWGGRSLNKWFNGSDSTSFPQLNTLNERLRYEFVITLDSIGGNPNYENWNEEVTFNINVAAGQSNNLNRLAGTAGQLVMADWERDKALGISGGVSSIGRWNNPQNQLVDTQVLSWTFRDSKLPKFASDAPSFTNITSTSVDMWLTLDNKGTVYYVIGKANGGNGRPEITTTRYILDDDTDKEDPDNGVVISRVSGSTNQMYVTMDGPNLPPDDGTMEAMPDWMKGIEGGIPVNEVTATTDDPGMPNHVISPTNQQIFNPGGVEGGASAIKGSVKSEAFRQEETHIDGLEPNTDYFVYCVIKGEADPLSHVYIYHFKTDLTAKPKINLNPLADGSSDLWTDVSAQMVYTLFNRTEAWQIPNLSRPFSEVVDSEKVLPDCWWDENWTAPDDGRPEDLKNTFTVLDALVTNYSNASAKKSGNADEAYIPLGPNKSISRYEGGYSVFDIYADDNIREKIDNLVRTNAESNSIAFIDHGSDIPSPGGGEPGKINVIDTSKLEPANYYVILTVGQNPTGNSNQDDGTPDYQKDSFKANTQIYQTAGEAPNLMEGSSVYIIANENGTYEIGGTLIFDKPLYEKLPTAPYKQPLTGERLTAMMVPKDNPPKFEMVSDNTSGESTAAEIFSFQQSLTQLGKGPYTVAGGTICNAAPTAAPEQLMIGTRLETRVVDGVSVKYAVVYVQWGQQGTADHDYVYIMAEVALEEPSGNDDNQDGGQNTPTTNKDNGPGIIDPANYTGGDDPLAGANLGVSSSNNGYKPTGGGTSNNNNTSTPGSNSSSTATPTVNLSPTSVTLDMGGTKTATVKATVSNGTATKYAWTSSNANVVTVTGSGANATLTAKGIGTATVTCTATVGGKTYTKTTAVTVKGSLTGMKLNSSSGSASLSGTTLTLKRGGTTPSATLGFTANGTIASGSQLSVLSVKDSAGKDASKYLSITPGTNTLTVKLGSATPGSATTLTVTVGIKSGSTSLTTTAASQRTFKVTISGNDANISIGGKRP